MIRSLGNRIFQPCCRPEAGSESCSAASAAAAARSSASRFDFPGAPEKLRAAPSSSTVTVAVKPRLKDSTP